MNTLKKTAVKYGAAEVKADIDYFKRRAAATKNPAARKKYEKQARQLEQVFIMYHL
jgi:hypothetical protein